MVVYRHTLHITTGIKKKGTGDALHHKTGLMSALEPFDELAYALL
jgi:hypothetical protein